MTCEQFEDLILDEIDGRIAPEMARTLHHHLEVCAECREFLTAQRELDRALGSLRAPQPSPHFAKRVWNRLQPELWHRLQPVSAISPSFLWDLAGVASVAAAAGVGVAYLTPHLLMGAPLGLPWMAAGAVLCAGAWLTLAEPSTPSA